MTSLSRTPARTFTARLAVLALGVGLAAAVQAPAHAADDPVAGAQTLTPSDTLFPNQGNSGYDASHYDVDLKVDVAVSSTVNALSSTSFPQASTTMTATTTGAPLSSFSMDFQGSTGNLAAATLNVDGVTVNGQAATFTRIENTTTSNATTDVHKIIITPATPVSGTFTTEVDYSGTPVRHVDTDGSSEGWVSTVDGAVFVNQPVGAMTAFPHNNTPRDKATWTFTIDAPSRLGTSNNTVATQPGVRSAGVVSNGELLSQTPSADGSRTTWVWDQKVPMASELSVLGIGRYDVYTSDITLASGRTIREWTFIDPATSVAQQTTTLSTRAQIKQVLDFYESKYGPYPGNSTGLITDVSSQINYALETQDRPYMGSSASRGTFFHEIMHQWWGDNVAPFDWNDITLNEGPATYAEYQYPFEGAGSSTTSTETAVYNLWNATAATNSAFNTPPAAMTQASTLFGAHVYSKGAMALEALRTSIGAASFETLMRQYQLTYGGGQITGRRTAAFQAMAESISGRNLGAFFQTWWYATGKPAWPAKYNVSVAGPVVQVNANDIYDYTFTVRNTGKVAMAAGAAVVTVDLGDVMDDVVLGNLPAGATMDGTTMTWSVPATALGATTIGTLPVFVPPGVADGTSLSLTESISTLGGTCLTCSTAMKVGAAPISPASVPTISGGTPTVGTQLSADTSGWAAGTTFAYQWSIDGTPVPGATAATWTPDANVVGLGVTVQVTGTLEGFTRTSRTSAATAVGVRATPLSSLPTVTGTPAGGSRLTCDPGTWQAGTLFTYTWAANGTTISGATGPSYVPAVATQVGQALTCTVTGTRSGYTTTARTSAPTAAVATGTPTLTPTPTITGIPRVGTVLTAVPGTWDYNTTFGYVWSADNAPIAGATTATLTPTAAQLGQVLTVAVTGTKPAVTTTTKTSAATAVVGLGVQTLQPTPTITGAPRAGTFSTAVPGTWDAGTTQAFQWYAGGAPVAGATTTSYTPTDDQIGADLTFEVTSTRADYVTVTRTSAAKAVVARAQTLTPTPAVLGAPVVGNALQADPGTWDDGTTLAYQWLVGDEPVGGADAPSYTLTAGDVGKTVSLRVTSTRATYETVSRTSAPTAAVEPGTLSQAPTPTISGTPRVDMVLAAVPGDWDEGVAVSYQWLADGDERSGATDSQYVPGAAELGKEITVRVTGTRPGYASLARLSQPTAAVASGQLGLSPVPTITGTAQAGRTLTAVPGDWDAGVTLAYQWFVDGDPVDGATATTYVPGTPMIGRTVTVVVTGSREAYASVSRTSAPTGTVAPADQVSTPTPTIAGTPRVGSPLTAVPGDWDAGTTLGYQWSVDGVPVAGATGATFVPTVGALGATVSVTVRGDKPDHLTVTRTSAPTAPVAAGAQVLTPTPTIVGDPVVGVTLTAVPQAWDAGATLAYQWYVADQPVAGSTTSTYVPATSDLGQPVRVTVTGTRAGYVTVSRTSAPTAVVTAAVVPVVTSSVPSVLGTVKVGSVVTAAEDVWTDGTSFTYQWQRDGSPIAGATARDYTPVAADAATALTVHVTGSLAGYRSVTQVSAPRTVALGTQLKRPRASIGGRPVTGRTLTAKPGPHDAGTTVAYRWHVGTKRLRWSTRDELVLRARDVGTKVWVEVAVRRAGYAGVSDRSAKVGPVRVAG